MREVLILEEEGGATRSAAFRMAAGRGRVRGSTRSNGVRSHDLRSMKTAVQPHHQRQCLAFRNRC